MTISTNPSAANDPSSPRSAETAIEVVLSADQLNAYVRIKPSESGGCKPSLEELSAALIKSGINFGVDNTILAKLAQHAIYNTNILVAQGIAPANGSDGRYELLFKQSKASKPKERDDGTVDYHDLELIENVKQGQVLCLITPPTSGTDGTSVLGNPLRARNGKPAPKLLGKNTQLSEDSTQIYAAISGYVDFACGKINVNDTLFIKENVDTSTGDIRTASNVIINGTVFPGFAVTSEGSVQIGGPVSGSSITAGGNVVLKSGIIGGHLKCEGDLTSKFMENCDVSVNGNIHTDYIMNCNVQCSKSILVRGSISKIVGGSCMAGDSIQAHIIGSSSGIKTHLQLGHDPVLVARQQELTQHIPELETKTESLRSLIQLFKQFEAAKRLTPDKEKAYQDAQYSYQTCTALLRDEKQELEEINAYIKLKGYGKIICSGTICSGTIIKIGNFKRDIQMPLTGRSLYYTDNGIREAPAT